MAIITLSKLLAKFAKHICSVPLTLDQEREIKGRLRFAGVDLENVKLHERDLVLDVITACVKPGKAPAQERNASVSSCPRCNNSVQSVKLADGSEHSFCAKCRVVA